MKSIHRCIVLLSVFLLLLCPLDAFLLVLPKTKTSLSKNYKAAAAAAAASQSTSRLFVSNNIQVEEVTNHHSNDTVSSLLSNGLLQESSSSSSSSPAAVFPQDLAQLLEQQLTPEMIADILRKYTTSTSIQSSTHAFERDEYWEQVRQHVTKASTMPPEAFRSEEFYRVEQEKLFAATWQVAAFTDQLRETGDVVTANVAGQPILLTRARDGQIRGFFNVCRHRGARLVQNPTEEGKKCISCPYHNWGYSLDGRLLGTPLWGRENKAPDEILAERLEASGTTKDIHDFQKEDFGLLPVRIETWGPFVYANVDGEAPPLKEYLGRVTEDLQLYPFEDLVTVRNQDVPNIKANWKLLSENFMDFYHVPTVHPGYCEVSRFDDHDRSQGDGNYLCHITYPLTNAGSALDLDRFPMMPGIQGTKHAKTGWFHLHFPNMFYFLLPHSMFVVVIEPTGPATSTEHVRLLVHKDSLEEAGEEEDAQEAIQGIWEAYFKVNSEDFQICEECQIGANVLQFKGGRMTWTLEENINRFHKMVANCMTGNPHVIPKADPVLSAFDRIPVYNDDDNKNDE